MSLVMRANSQQRNFSQTRGFINLPRLRYRQQASDLQRVQEDSRSGSTGSLACLRRKVAGSSALMPFGRPIVAAARRGTLLLKVGTSTVAANCGGRWRGGSAEVTVGVGSTAYLSREQAAIKNACAHGPHLRLVHGRPLQHYLRPWDEVVHALLLALHHARHIFVDLSGS
jgi:hypothetical protein